LWFRPRVSSRRRLRAATRWCSQWSVWRSGRRVLGSSTRFRRSGRCFGAGATMPSCGQSTPTTKNGLGKSRTGSSPLASAGAAPQRVEYDGDVATPVTGLDSVGRIPAKASDRWARTQGASGPKQSCRSTRTVLGAGGVRAAKGSAAALEAVLEHRNAGTTSAKTATSISSTLVI